MNQQTVPPRPVEPAPSERNYFPIVIGVVVAVIVLIVAAVLLMGGDDDDDNGDNGDSSVPTLSETFTHEEEGVTITVNHPSGWVTNAEFGSVELANSQAALDRLSDSMDSTDLQGDDIALNISAAPSFMATSPSELLNMFTSQAGSDAVQPGEVTESQINGNNAARTTISQNGNVFGEMIAVQVNPDYILLIVAAAGDYNAARATIDAIVSSATVSGEPMSLDMDIEPMPEVETVVPETEDSE